MSGDRIFINGLRLMALVGVLPKERVELQPVRVDCELEVDVARAGTTDDLHDTANYGAIADAIAEVVGASSDMLLERLVARIVERVLQFDRVESATVTLTKLQPPLDLDVDSTAVRVTRSKAGVAFTGRHRAIVALGSNLGDRAAYLRYALDQLPTVVATSQVFETEPVGGPDDQGPYLNMVAVVDTDLDPWALLRRLLRIEADADRVRTQRWGPRTLDLDILFYDDYVIDSGELTVPHPRHGERRFVLEPLSEVAPERCPAHWRDRLPAHGITARGSLESLLGAAPGH